ncbi:hypothetical protein M0L20_13525 [Spirosoma sp. RP8]|uniref:Uncharacterized protein n=1 Tax=Spirosoma liriopis TaxID=2937440 RepID=A0ABT0HL55_9BACT|nr:hypothetical protein [Spirosoma liriopis]MCK8492882.1 hypothetical protein [Spirosoma liriopis]
MITDLLSLTEFIEQIATGTAGIVQFLALSNGEKAVDEISAFYNDTYAGTTAFFQIAEIGPKDNRAGLQQVTFYCSLTVAEKPDDVSARAGLATRDNTMKLLLSILGQLKIKAEESAETVEQEGEGYQFCVTPSERIFPIGMLANVSLEGYYVDLDITISANHLLFP